MRIKILDTSSGFDGMRAAIYDSTTALLEQK
jgi:hypothetical protein